MGPQTANPCPLACQLFVLLPTMLPLSHAYFCAFITPTPTLATLTSLHQRCNSSKPGSWIELEGGVLPSNMLLCLSLPWSMICWRTLVNLSSVNSSVGRVSKKCEKWSGFQAGSQFEYFRVSDWVILFMKCGCRVFTTFETLIKYIFIYLKTLSGY
jgi:hypothetical protein